MEFNCLRGLKEALENMTAGTFSSNMLNISFNELFDNIDEYNITIQYNSEYFVIYYFNQTITTSPSTIAELINGVDKVIDHIKVYVSKNVLLYFNKFNKYIRKSTILRQFPEIDKNIINDTNIISYNKFKVFYIINNTFLIDKYGKLILKLKTEVT